MAKSINYNSRTFDDYKEQLKIFTQRYYPEIINDFQDASVAQWFMELNAAVADDLGYHIDKKFQETQLDYANERKSLLSIARTNGLKVQGKRPSILEAKWTCYLPVDSTQGQYTPDWSYAPRIRKGTQATGAGQKFEIIKDIDFSEQFNSSGVSDRTIIPLNDASGNLVGYNVSKTCVMQSSEGKIYKQYINSSDIEPFMNIILPDNNVINIESILVYDGYVDTTPNVSEFIYNTTNKWVEVDNLTEDKVFSKDFVNSINFKDKIVNNLSGSTEINDISTYGNTFVAKTNNNDYIYGFIPSIAKWNSITKKFITEYTDNGFCKIIFGSGVNESETNASSIANATDFNQYLMNKIINNKYLGELPKSNSTIFIYYSVGGGKQSVIAKDVMKTITNLVVDMDGGDINKITQVRNSITVTNTTPSISGRDEMTNDEIRYLIKYNNSAQDRCVTIKDYENRILTMPSEYAAPFKLCVSEVNNKILITMLGLNYDGTLSPNLSEALINNLKTYLSEYRMINDYIEIQPGRIVNLQFEVDITLINENNKQNIVRDIILYLTEYMDINNHKMGDEIYVNKIKADISSMSGVKNLTDLRVYNVYSSEYSSNQIKQPFISGTQDYNRKEVDLISSDGVLYSDNDTMFEIKYPRKDIKITIKK